MNIREAALQLERTALAYAARTPEGAYRVPRASQRPVYLVGPPGVGKSAVVAQAAARLGIGYDAYTMTHHTRQSALGLPMIVHRTLNGAERPVTEYTMSEIVAGVWQKAEAGAETGMLFLDEINCVSESLMPAMLQLLQYKTFGTHELPRGWMIVCAGNPPRYNRYARTFDAVVMDRLRVIEVEPELAAWQAFAVERGVHPLVRSYLALRGGDFYVPDGDRIVTARSWTDLSDMMLALEDAGCAPDEGLYGQFLQVDEVAGRFRQYARLCADIGARLDGALEGGTEPPLAGLPFGEAVFAALLLAGRLEAEAEKVDRRRGDAERLENFARGVSREYRPGGESVQALCREQIRRLEKALAARLGAGILDEAGRAREAALIDRLDRLAAGLRGLGDVEALEALERQAGEEVLAASADEEALAVELGRGLDLAERSLTDPNARLVFLNDLRAHGAAGRLIRARLGQRFDGLWEGCDPDARLRRAGDSR